MKKKKSLNLIDYMFIGVAIILFAILGFSFINSVESKALKENKISNLADTPLNEVNVEVKEEAKEEIKEDALKESEEDDYVKDILKERQVVDNISDFDLSFLKLENLKKNKVYSPLSIKSGLKMIQQGSMGIARWKIIQSIGNRDLTKYTANSNMSFANAFFIRDSYKENISKDYIEDLKTNHNVEVMFDEFKKPDNINSWVSDKTFKLIDNLVSEQNMNADFMLINALAIDMEWRNKFLESIDYAAEYLHEQFGWWSPESLEYLEFGENKEKVSSMKVLASINNYDIVSELGEENIKNTVYKAFLEYCDENPNEYMYEKGDFAPEKREETFNKYFYGTTNEQYSYYDLGYISELNSNYGDVAFNTDFSLYVDDKVKVFAKDLKEYDETTLQYIGIMPVSEELDSYIQNINKEKINHLINNLKDLKCANFKDGVVTKIEGNIPKFKFEYDLDLKEDLKKIGLGHIFEQENANLDFISKTDQVYIQDAIHKAVIEFTQDGIKAAAATSFGGGGGGGSFDYLYEVPVEKIDITFDKPYMFLIRDKKTGELWFAGTVYEPFSWTEEDPMYTGAY